jgi:hypothetical protein
LLRTRLIAENADLGLSMGTAISCGTLYAPRRVGAREPAAHPEKETQTGIRAFKWIEREERRGVCGLQPK